MFNSIAVKVNVPSIVSNNVCSVAKTSARMVYCPELIVSYSLFLFLFCQLLFVLLVFASTYGRLHRGIIETNEVKEISPQDNSVFKFFEWKKAVNDAQPSVWKNLRDGQREAVLKGINFVLKKATFLTEVNRQKVCLFSHCECEPPVTCKYCARCRS